MLNRDNNKKKPNNTYGYIKEKKIKLGEWNPRMCLLSSVVSDPVDADPVDTDPVDADPDPVDADPDPPFILFFIFLSDGIIILYIWNIN